MSTIEHENRLAVRPRGELMPAMTVEEGVERFNEMKRFVHSVMRPGEHFGTIPGTQKRTLFKAGAEMLCSFFGLRPDFTREAGCLEDWSKGQFAYVFKCTLRNREGELVASGWGSCNGGEKKYKHAAAKGEGADIANTILKMAQKRALVAATLIGANASAFFTQDIEDGYATVADGPTQTAKAAAAEARLRGDPAPTREVIDEPPPFLTEDPTDCTETPFEAWIKVMHAEAAKRGIPEDAIDEAIDIQAEHNRVRAIDAPQKWYAAVLGFLRDGAYDKWIKIGTPTAPAPLKADDKFAEEAARGMEAETARREAKKAAAASATSATKKNDGLDDVFAKARKGRAA